MILFIFNIIFIFLIFALLMGFFCFIFSRTFRKRTSQIKGEKGELKIFNILSVLPWQQYKVLNNIILQSNYGMTQIDHIVISVFGIFVIETKNYSGNISGTENSEQWIQNLYGNKTFFHNPIKQNYAHIKALQEVLDLSYEKFISIIVFSGSNFINVKTNKFVVNSNQLLNVIQTSNIYMFSESEISLFFDKIISLNLSGEEAKKQHLEQVRTKKTNYEIKISQGICPKCGHKLIEHNGKYGYFLGCSNYPKCKFTYKSNKKYSQQKC